METKGSSSQRIAGLVVAWIVVATVMALFAWQAVSAAGSRVSDQPLYPLSAGAPAVLDDEPGADTSTVVRLDPAPDQSGASPTTEDPASLTPPTVDSSAAGSSTTATTQSGATGSGSPDTSAAPSTSVAPATSTTAAATTTTTGAVAMERATYVLVGGTVTIEYGGGQVVLISAVPKAGFDTEVDHDGPVEVDLDFRSEGHRSRFDAEWKNGGLVVDIDEDPEG